MVSLTNSRGSREGDEKGWRVVARRKGGGGLTYGPRYYGGLKMTDDDQYLEALDTLSEIPGASGRLSLIKVREWCLKKNIDPTIALDIALAMKATIGFDSKRKRWEYISATGAKRSYVNLMAVFQSWARRQNTASTYHGPKRQPILLNSNRDHGW